MVLSSLALFAPLMAIALSVAAGQQALAPAQQNLPTATVTGQVRTSSGAGVPGATLRLVETASGRTWMSWTDENGRFSLPGLPAGHYRVEVSQLGFDTAVVESEVGATPPPPPMAIALKVASLEALTAPPAATAAQQPSESAGAPQTQAAVAANASTAAAAGATQPAAGAGAANRGGFRGGRGAGGNGAAAGGRPGVAGAPNGPGGAGRGGRGGGFAAVNLNNGNNGGATQDEVAVGEENADVAQPAAGGADAFGQASSSDAFLMAGTVGRGDETAGGFGFPGAGGEFGGPGGPGGFGGPGGDANAVFGFPGGAGAAGGVPGVPGFPGAAPAGAAGPVAIQAGGGPGGGFGGGPGGGFGGGGGGGGGRGGGGGGGAGGGPGRGGGRPGAQGPGRGGVQPLFGLARLARQRVNRIRIGLTDDYSNSALNARPYSLSGVTAPKIGAWQEGFGGTLGGPLRIPKVYDGSDRTFFFLNYNLNRGRTAVDQFSTVPTTAERQGDFSDRGAQLYNPFSNLSGPRTSWGSVIPAGAMSPSSLNLLQYIPQPNLPGLVQNYHLQSQVPSATDRFSVRIQQTISPKVNFSVNYNFQEGNNHNLQSFPDFERNQSTRGQSLTLQLNENLSRTFIHTTQFFFTRNRSQSLNLFANQQNIAAQAGISGVSTAPIDYGVPLLSFTNFTNASDPVPSLSRNETFRVVDSIRYLMAKHTITAGAEVRRMFTNTESNPTPRGAFTFSGATTSQLDASGKPVPGTGLDFADFLLGLPISTSVRFGTPSTYLRNWAYAGYLNDDWRMTPRFSLTYGVRYEAITPLSERYGHIANLLVTPDFTQAAVVVPGQASPFGGSLPPALVRGDYNNWSPRLGLAWRPLAHAAVIVRAGYSLVYNGQVYNGFASSMASQPPFAQSQTLQSSPTQVLTLANGFPVASPNALTNTIAIDPNYQLAYAQVWNLSVQIPTFRNLPITVVYTGTKGTHLDTLMGFSNSPLAATQGSAIQNAQGFTYDTSAANSIFHALQLRTQGRVNRNLRLGVAYTFGKSIDDASSIGGGQQVIVQNNQDLAAERGLSSFDMRQQLRVNFGYDLPFGERQRFAKKGFASSLLGNWTLTNTINAHSGTPFTARIFNSACQILPGVYSERANQITDPSLPADERTVQEFFNTAAFAAPIAGCTGDASRNTIMGPGSFTLNTDLTKTIRIGRDGQHTMQIHWEVNNLTNAANFTSISTVVNSATFGHVTGVSGMRTMTLHMRLNF